MMTLSDILSQPEGFTPPGIKVRVVRVYDQKSGEGEKGPWSFQDVEVEDSSGKGRLKLKNIEPLPADRQGKELILTAHQSKQHGLTGLKVLHEQYQGKTYDKIVVTSSAQWTWETNGTKPAATSPTASQPAYTAVAHPPIAHAPTGGFKEHLLACADIAILVASRLQIKDDQARQACFATVCIDAQKQGVVLDRPEKISVPPEPVAASPTPTDAATRGQRVAISNLCKTLNIQSAMSYLNDVGCLDPADLTQQQAGEVIDILQNKIDAGS